MKKNYKDLLVWQKAIDLAPSIYQVLKQFPKEEQYALAAQLRRAIVSIPANVAEGQSRGHLKEFLQHLNIAKGSLAEVETLLIIAQKLGYLEMAQLQSLEMELNQVGKMLNGLIRSLVE